MKYCLVWVLLIGLLLAFNSQADTSQIVTTKIEGHFPEVVHNIKSAIAGKGINIAHILPASSMLNRTGSAYGYKENVFLDAQIIEFCSARLSQKLARLDPDNILACPFVIGATVIPAEPDVVRVSYRVPTARPGAEAVVHEIVELMQSIIEDASW